MIVRRYFDPVAEIAALRRQINEVFGDFIPEAVAKPGWVPSLRLVDQGHQFELTAYLPGIQPAEVEVEVTRDTVAIRGNRAELDLKEGSKLLYDDIRYGSYQRLVNLPEAVQNEQVTADFSQGVLTLTLPKLVDSRHRVVKVNLSGAPAVNGSEATDSAAAAQEPTLSQH
ncbi:MAG: Hsp20/alpha crystallin family protein [Cyanobacteriota bacterium]|jgi:HSP20 family protein|nr:Hsp20/alpha crystallin family protein [Cyanobacteriota bacterium]